MAEPPEEAPEAPETQSPESDSALGDLPPAAGLYRVAWAFYLVLAIAALVWVGVREGGIRTNLLWAEGLAASGIARSLAIDLGLGIGSAVLIVGAWEICERRVSAAAEVAAQLRAMLGGLTASEAVGLALLSGVSEELFFRGAVQGSWPTWQGWLGATLLFAVLHGGPGKHFRWWTLFAAVAGGLMGGWFLLRGTLTAAIVAHIGVNGFQLLRMAHKDREETPAE